MIFSFGDQGWGDELLAGVCLTLCLAVCAFGLAMIIGLGGALASQSPFRIVRGAARVYGTVMRGIPEILILFLVYFGGSLVLAAVIEAVAATPVGHWLGMTDKPAFIDVSAFAAGVLALSLVSGAYQMAVMQSALAAVPVGQIEAARALGMSPLMILWRVTLPQMWRYALPAMGNLWQVMLKDTAIVSVINLPELLRVTDVAGRSTRLPFTFFLASALLYLLLTWISSHVVARAEARVWRGMARR